MSWNYRIVRHVEPDGSPYYLVMMPDLTLSALDVLTVEQIQKAHAQAALLASCKWALDWLTRRNSGAFAIGLHEDVEIARTLASAISAVEKAEQL